MAVVRHLMAAVLAYMLAEALSRTLTYSGKYIKTGNDTQSIKPSKKIFRKKVSSFFDLGSVVISNVAIAPISKFLTIFS